MKKKKKNNEKEILRRINADGHQAYEKLWNHIYNYGNMHDSKNNKLFFCISRWQKLMNIYSTLELAKAGLADTKHICFYSSIPHWG